MLYTRKASSLFFPDQLYHPYAIPPDYIMFSVELYDHICLPQLRAIKLDQKNYKISV